MKLMSRVGAIALFVTQLGLSSLNTASAAAIKVGGSVSGFGTLTRDDVIDAAIVIPTLRARDLLNFQLATLLGPSETMKAGPLSVKVPGNFFFPRQSEKYGILPITIEKPRFNLFIEAGSEEELVAISVSAPFSKGTELARNKAPYSELLPLLTIKRVGLTSEQVWQPEAKMDIPLSSAVVATANFEWIRSRASASETDLIIVAQETPAQRWLPTDLVAKPAAKGVLKTSAGLTGALKVIMARLTNDAKGDPIAGVGYFVKGSPKDLFHSEGVPQSIANASFVGTRVSWNPILTPGWMAIIRDQKNARAAVQQPDYDYEIFPFVIFQDRGPRALFSLGNKQLEQWVPAGVGFYDFKVGRNANDSLSLLFIGTDQDVPAPDSGSDDSSLFDHAAEFRMTMVP